MERWAAGWAHCTWLKRSATRTSPPRSRLRAAPPSHILSFIHSICGWLLSKGHVCSCFRQPRRVLGSARGTSTLTRISRTPTRARESSRGQLSLQGAAPIPLPTLPTPWSAQEATSLTGPPRGRHSAIEYYFDRKTKAIKQPLQTSSRVYSFSPAGSVVRTSIS